MQGTIPQYLIQPLENNTHNGSFVGYTIFIDISGFTQMTEELMLEGVQGAEILSNILNKLFQEIIGYVYHSGGFISTFAGDAFTAIFPNTDFQGILAVIYKISLYFQKYSHTKTRFKTFNLAVKIGVSYEKVEWGILGNEQYKSFYFRGDGIDNATKAEHYAEKNEVIIDNKIQSIINENQEQYTPYLDQNVEVSPQFHKIQVNSKVLENHTKHNSTDFASLNDTAFHHQFFPMLKPGITPEFRNIASAFISFDDIKEHHTLNKVFIDILGFIQEYGGYLSSLDFGDKGSLIYVMFGAPITYEDNVSRAINFVYTLKNQLDITIRVGITKGDVYTGLVGSSQRKSYTALGDAVNISARFMSHAEDNQVLVTQEVADTVKRTYETIFLNHIQLKGKTDNIATYELKNPIFFEPTGIHTGPFVGRVKELEFLDENFQIFFNGKFPGWIYVHGDVGMGKSRLLYEYTKDLEKEKNLSIIVLQTNETDILRKSLNPFISFFKEYFDLLPEDSKEELKNKFVQGINKLKEEASSSYQYVQEIQHCLIELDRSSSIIAGLLSIVIPGSINEALEPKSRFENSLIAIKNFFMLLSYIKPRILVVEDFSFVEEDTVKALEFLTSNLDKVPLILLCPCRTNDDGSVMKFLDSCDVEKNILIEPLSHIEVKEFLHAFLGNTPPDEKLLQFLTNKTGNNPLYLREICSYLVENKLLIKKGSQYSININDAKVPVNISNILISKIDRLSEELKNLVQLASILGKKLNIHLLKKICSDESSFEKNLELGIEKNIWSKLSESQYVFSEVLLRDTAYEMQLKQDLVDKHHKIALILESLNEENDVHYTELAYHFEKGNDKNKAIYYLQCASKIANLQYKSQRSIEIFDKLVLLLDEQQEINNIFGRKAEIYELSGEFDLAVQYLKEGIQHGFENDLYENALSLQAYLGEIYLKMNLPQEATAILTNNLKKIKNFNLKSNMVFAKTYLNLGRVYLYVGDNKKATAIFHKAFKFKNKMKDALGQGLVKYYSGIIYKNDNKLSKSISTLTKALKIFKTIHNNKYIGLTLYELALTTQKQGKLQSAIYYFREVLDIYKKIGFQVGEAEVTMNLAYIQFLKGNMNKVEVLLSQSFTIAKEANDNKLIAYNLYLRGMFNYKNAIFTEAEKCFKQSWDIIHEHQIKIYYTLILTYITCNFINMKQYAKSIKSLYWVFYFIKDFKQDLEYGRIYLALAKLLQIFPKDKLKQTKYIQKLIKLNPNIDFNIDSLYKQVIQLSLEAMHLSTLLPAFCSYADFLYSQNQKIEALKQLKKAKEYAKKYSFNLEFEKINKIEQKILKYK